MGGAVGTRNSALYLLLGEYETGLNEERTTKKLLALAGQMDLPECTVSAGGQGILRAAGEQAVAPRIDPSSKPYSRSVAPLPLSVCVHVFSIV